MLIAFDIGNTNIVVGGFDGQELCFEFRINTDSNRTIDEYAALMLSLLERKTSRERRFEACVISSVVPPVTPDITAFVRDEFGIEPLLVGPGVKTGLQIKTIDPAAVGSDRIVNAVAAKHLYGSPALVIDFGTATSFDMVSSTGDYLGGVIAPGLRSALDSLVRSTAKLPRIELCWPERVIGNSTVTAMQSGAVIGYVSLVDGLIEKILEEQGEIKSIVSTGGLGILITSHSKHINEYHPNLTLVGMRLIAEMNNLVES